MTTLFTFTHKHPQDPGAILAWARGKDKDEAEAHMRLLAGEEYDSALVEIRTHTYGGSPNSPETELQGERKSLVGPTDVTILRWRVQEKEEEIARLQARLDQVKAAASADKYLRLATALARMIVRAKVITKVVTVTVEEREALRFVQMVQDADIHADQVKQPRQEVPVL